MKKSFTICIVVLSVSIIIVSFILLSEDADNQNESLVSFIDQRGISIHMDNYPKRMLVIPYDGSTGVAMHYAVARNLDAIIAVDSNRHSRVAKTIYSQVFKGYLSERLHKKRIRRGGQINVETIANFNPDLVIQWDINRWVEAVKKVGFKVVSFKCCTEQNRLGYIDIAGHLADRRKEAKKIIDINIDSKQKLGNQNNKQKFTMLIMYSSRGAFKAYVNKFVTEMYPTIGAVNLADSGGVLKARMVDYEQIIKWNPDIIIYPGWSYPRSLKGFHKLKNDKILASLNAIKNKEIFIEPQFGRISYGPELFLMSEWLYILGNNDERLAKEFRERIKSVYQDVYGFNATENDIDAILIMDQNGYSDRYRRLFGRNK